MARPEAERKRAHVERMLALARRREKRAAKLVRKWEQRVAELDRGEVDAKQAKLWEDDAARVVV
jgi:hypothetical protein